MSPSSLLSVDWKNESDIYCLGHCWSTFNTKFNDELIMLMCCVEHLFISDITAAYESAYPIISEGKKRLDIC